MGFTPPSARERERAAGPLELLAPELQRAFSDAGHFEPVPSPRRSDWLSIAREKGQSFERFTRGHERWLTAHHICLQPVGDFDREQHALLQQLQRFAVAFFARDVELLPAISIDGFKTRRNRFTEDVQLNSRDLLARLIRHVPDDAGCMLAVTAMDLYPHDTWSFVFGEAMVGDRAGVFSFARYDPRFYGKPVGDPTLMLRRTCKVLAHETCHMLGMMHCVFFNCLMNGSNHLDESDRRPLHLCPIDLRKLHWSLGFDVAERYRRLRDFWRSVNVAAEADWIQRRLEFVEGRALGSMA
jgi:archaemetzincin